MIERINRLNEVINRLGVTKHALATISGIAPTNFNKMLNGGQNITDKTLRKIANKFPELNETWLLTGEGEMLKASPQISESILLNDSEDDLVPLLPIEAMAGSLQYISQGVELAGCRKIKSPVHGADWAIQISGDSMEPKYENGMILYIRKISGSFIPWGQPMIVDTYDGVIFKEIYPVEENKDLIKAVSLNPKYPPFNLDKSSIIGLYRVLGGTFINSTI